VYIDAIWVTVVMECEKEWESFRILELEDMNLVFRRQFLRNTRTPSFSSSPVVRTVIVAAAIERLPKRKRIWWGVAAVRAGSLEN